MTTLAPTEAPLPKNYRLVFDIVHESGLGQHLTMPAVFARAAERRPGIGYSTVYRGLVRLRELGLIAEIVLPGADAATYEPIAPPHAHVRCRACGRIDDASYALPPRVLRAVAAATGYAIESGSVTFEGRCVRCTAGASRYLKHGGGAVLCSISPAATAPATSTSMTNLSACTRMREHPPSTT